MTVQEEDFPRGGGRTPNEKRRRAELDGDGVEAGVAAGDAPSRPFGAVWKRRLVEDLCLPGLQMLACVRKVEAAFIDLEVSNGIFGRLPIEGDLLASADAPTLYVPGQLLACQCVSVRSGFRRMELSVEPSLLSSHLIGASLQEGLILPGAVLSVEDNGLRVDLGLSSVVGFAPNCELPSRESQFGVGQAFLCRLLQSVQADERVAKVSLKLSPAAGKQRVESLPSVGRQDLMPGMVLGATPVEETSAGVLVEFSGTVGFVSHAHMSPKLRQSLARRIAAAKPFAVVVTFVQRNSNMIGLSAVDALLDMHACRARTLFEGLHVGSVVKATVQKVSRSETVHFDVGSQLSGVAARTALQLTDGASSADVLARYAVGSSHRVRVVDYRLLDHLLVLSARRDVLKQKMLSVQDAKLGDVVEATVDFVKRAGVYVKIYGKIKGFVPIMHTADQPLTKLTKAFKLGDAIQCRVLKVERNRLVVTCKKTLVESKLPLICTYEAASVGVETHGCIVQVQERGVLVCLFGNVKGFARLADLRASGFDSTAPFSVGQPVRVRILSIDASKQGCLLTVLSIGSLANTTPDKASVAEAGLLCQARVEGIATESLRLCLLPSGAAVRLCLAELTDALAAPSTLLQSFKSGDHLEEAVVWSSSGAAVEATARPLLLRWVREGRQPTRFEQLEPRQLVVGRVARRNEQLGYFVDLPGGLSALAPFGLVEGGSSSTLRLGQTVLARVQHVNGDKQRFAVNLRPRNCYPSDAPPLDLALELVRQALRVDERCRAAVKPRALPAVGALVRAVITRSVDAGFTCRLADFQLDGYVTFEHVGKRRVGVDEEVRAFVLSVDFPECQVGLSLLDVLVASHSSGWSPKPGDACNGRIVHVGVDYTLATILRQGKPSGQLAYLPSRLHPNDPPPDCESRRLSTKVKLNVCAAVAEGRWLAATEKDELALTEFACGSAADDGVLVLPRGRRLKMGELYDATVAAAPSHFDRHQFVTIDFGPATKGRLHISELLDEIETEGSKPLETFLSQSVGQKVKVKVIGFHREKRRLDDKKADRKERRVVCHRLAECSVRPSKMELNKRKKVAIGYTQMFHVGDVVAAYVTAAASRGVQMTVTPEWSGFVNCLQLSANCKVALHPAKYFSAGQAFETRVVGVDKRRRRLTLSLLSPSAAAVSAGERCVAAVDAHSAADDCAALLRLPGGGCGRVPWTELADDYEQRASALRRLAEAACFKVLPIKRQADESWLVSVRGSAVSTKPVEAPVDERIVAPSQLKKGRVVRGFVHSCKPNAGVFVEIGADIVGRVQFKNATSKAVEREVTIDSGTLVTVSVLSVASDRLELSMLPRQTKVADQVTISDERTTPPAKRARLDVAVKEEQTAGISIFSKRLDGAELDAGAADAADDAADCKDLTMSDPGIDWTPARFAPSNLMAVGWRVKQEQEEISAEGATDGVDGFAAVGIDDEAAERRRKSLLSDAGETQSAEMYDQSVNASPDSSILWLRYMAFFVQSAQIEKARATGERALETISFAADQERFNIWTAMLNLENSYGDAEALSAVFARATNACDPIKMHKQLLRIYQHSGKVEAADALVDEMLRKFRLDDDEVWFLAGQHFMDTARPERMRELMQRALSSLPPARHVSAMSRFAQLEFRGGDGERGATLFETLLSTYPKRTDVWSVYIDMLAKHRSVDDARAVLERVTVLPLSSHKMRFFFKKWMELEERHGSAEAQKLVKQRAAAFVEKFQEQLL